MFVRRTGAVVALALAAVMLSGCATSLTTLLGGAGRDEEGQIESGGDLDVFTIKVGDCFFDDALAGVTGDEQSETSTVRAVPCDEKHMFEAYHDFTLPEGEFPGADVLDEKALTECGTAFDEYIGVPYEDSIYEYSYYTPSPETWEYNDDRLVSCVLSDPEGETLTGSLKGIGK
ncbi:septum formation family protein [Microbacterium sp. MM2322]|uniref:septum formation family protein n=1 Tax=Microbacterium sp. MM2322 TaxID=3157631 RepID=UPI0032D56B0C